MHHPHFHSNMSHDKKATEQNKKEIFQYCRACYSPDQTLRPLKRPTLAEFAFEFYKLQARVRRTKKLWQITRLANNGSTPFTYMYEPDGTLRTRLFDVPLQFWAKPKMIHRCTHCLTLTSLKCWYMPRCGRCEAARFCSHDCFKKGWDFHKSVCVKDASANKHDLGALFYSMATAIRTSAAISKPLTPFFEVSCADVYGERLLFRPVRFTQAVKRILDMPQEILRDLMKPPYQNLCFFVLTASDKNKLKYELATIHLTKNEFKQLPHIQTKQMVKEWKL